MQQPQCRLKQAYQIPTSDAHFLRIFRIQPRLDEFQIPVAELAPEKVVDAICHLVKAVVLKLAGHIPGDTVKPRENPAILQGLWLKSGNTSMGPGLWPGQGKIGRASCRERV